MFGIGYSEMILLGILAVGAIASLIVFVVAGHRKSNASVAPCPSCGKHIPRLTAVCHYCGKALR
jgi:hypothetical protein